MQMILFVSFLAVQCVVFVTSQPRPIPPKFPPLPPRPPVGKGNVHAGDDQQAPGDIKDECSEHSDKFIWGQRDNEVTLDDCVYYECDGTNYIEQACPDGRGTNRGFQIKWEQFKKGQVTDPCTAVNKNCELSLADKGLDDINTKVCSMDLIFAIDISCSIEPSDRPKVRNFVLNTINALTITPITTQVGGVAFSQKVSHIAYLNEYYFDEDYIRRAKSYARLKFAFRSETNPRGFHWNGNPCGTRGDLALQQINKDYFTVEHGARANVSRVVIYMSDGVTYPESYKPNTIQQARLLKQSGVTIIVIALPNKMRPMSEGEEEWNAIASSPDHIFFLNSFDKLKEIVNDLARKACKTL